MIGISILIEKMAMITLKSIAVSSTWQGTDASAREVSFHCQNMDHVRSFSKTSPILTFSLCVQYFSFWLLSHALKGFEFLDAHPLTGYLAGLLTAGVLVHPRSDWLH